MHWNSQKFIEIYNALNSDDENLESSDVSHLSALYNSVKGDFDKFLATPEKNSRSRDLLVKNEPLKFDDTLYEVSEELKIVAVEMSDSLNIDEIVAAEFVWRSSEDAIILNLSPLQAAIGLFYMRRQYLLNVVLYALYKLPTLNVTDGNDRSLTDLLAKFTAAISTGSVLKALKTTADSFERLSEYMRRGEFLNLTLDPSFTPCVNMQNEFLSLEESLLGQILTGLVECSKVNGKEFMSIVKQVAEVDRYNIRLITYLPAILRWCSSMDTPLSGLPSKTTSDYLSVKADLKKLDEWKLGYCRGAISFAFLVFFTGYCRNHPEDSSLKDINFASEISASIKQALATGGLELLMVVSYDISAKKEESSQLGDYTQLLRQWVPPLTTSTIGSSTSVSTDHLLTLFTPEFRDSMRSALELLVRAIACNVPQVLKELKLAEEDIYSAMYNGQDPADKPLEDNDPSPDLERLFILVANIYEGRENAAYDLFWSDTSSDLHGLLLYSAHSEVPFFSAAYCHMLSALACGNISAGATFHFLQRSVQPERSRSISNFRNMLSASSAQSNLTLTWSHMIDALEYYDQHLRPDSLPKQSQLMQGGAKTTLPANEIPVIDDDAALLVISYFQLISRIAKYNSDAKREMVSGEKDLVDLLFSLMSVQSALFAPILQCLAMLVKDLRELKLRVWKKLDEWLFETTIVCSNGQILTTTSSPQERSAALISTFESVNAFLALMDSLITGENPSYEPRTTKLPPKSTSEVTKSVSEFQAEREYNPSPTVSLQYPYELGSRFLLGAGGKTRPFYSGISPYVSFVVDEVLPAVSQATPELQSSLLEKTTRFLRWCLESFDPELARVCYVTGVSPDVLTTVPYLDYLKAHPSMTVMSNMFDERVYSILFDLLKNSSVIERSGVTTSAVDEDEETPAIRAIANTLVVLNKVMDLQETFIDVIVKDLRFKSNDSFFSNASTHGLQSFEQAFLFHLPSLVYLASHVGSPFADIATSSLKLLQRLAKSPVIRNSRDNEGLVNSNRLLAVFMSSDASTLIKDGFITQLERSTDFGDDDCAIKIQILSFLLASLIQSEDTSTPTIAHFLLGFDINGDNTLSLGEERTFIGSNISLLRSIVGLQNFASQRQSATTLPEKETQIASLCSRIVLQLVKEDISSQITLDYMRDENHAFTCISNDDGISGPWTLWGNVPFSSISKNDPELGGFYNSAGAPTMVAFFEQRAALLEYLSIEVRQVADKGALTLLNRYLNALVSNARSARSGKMLSLLDTLEFVVSVDDSDVFSLGDKLGTSRADKFLQLFYNNDVDPLLAGFDETEENARMMSELKKWFIVCDSEEVAVARAIKKPLLLTLTESTKVPKDFQQDVDVSSSIEEIEQHAKAKSAEVLRRFQRYLNCERLQHSQIRFTEAWTKLMLVLVSDTEMSRNDRISFVLETFQAVIPKMVGFFNTNVAMSEQISFLLKSLYSIYVSDVRAFGTDKIGDAASERTLDLVKASIFCIQSMLSTENLRVNAYSVVYQYLRSALKTCSQEFITQLAELFQNAGQKVIEIICRDALSSDKSTQLVSIVLLEALGSLNNRVRSTHLVETLVRFNLLLPIASSLGRTSIAIVDDGSLVNYKLFRSTALFLLQIAQSRLGASQLIENKLFEVLRDADALKIKFFAATTPQTGKPVDELLVPNPRNDILLPVVQLTTAIVTSMRNELAASAAKQFMSDKNSIVFDAFLADSVVNYKVTADPELAYLCKCLVALVTLTGV